MINVAFCLLACRAAGQRHPQQHHRDCLLHHPPPATPLKVAGTEDIRSLGRRELAILEGRNTTNERKISHTLQNVKRSFIAIGLAWGQAFAMTSLRQHIGSKIRLARQRVGISQEQLAEKVDKTRETVSNIERGEGLSGFDTLERIASALGEEVAFFLADYGSTQNVPRSRRELELKVKTHLRDLSDRDLKLVAELVSSMRDGC